MIVNAITKEIVEKGAIKRIEIRSPKFPIGKMLASLPSKYSGKEIKFITKKEDIKFSEPCIINDSKVTKDVFDRIVFTYGMCILINDIAYIYAAEVLVA